VCSAAKSDPPAMHTSSPATMRAAFDDLINGLAKRSGKTL
jgi:hypothetical protein